MRIGDSLPLVSGPRELVFLLAKGFVSESMLTSLESTVLPCRLKGILKQIPWLSRQGHTFAELCKTTSVFQTKILTLSYLPTQSNFDTVQAIISDVDAETSQDGRHFLACSAKIGLIKP